MTVRRSRRAVGGFLRDFQEFALKGNVVDLAVGVIIGTAFGRIVESLVNDVILTLVPVAGGNWSQWTLGPIAVGNLLSAILNFLIVAFVLFVVIRIFAQFLRDEAAEAPPDPMVESNERLREAVDRLTQTLQSRDF